MLIWPAKITENIAHNVHAAAREVIDGHEYAVLEITSSTTGQQVRDVLDENDYVKFLLQENINYSVADSNYTTGTGEKVVLWCTSSISNGRDIIFDLQGHTITFSSSLVGLNIHASHIEIRDSSAAGTGKINGKFSLYNRKGNNLSVDIYGGTFDKLNFYDTDPVNTATRMICKLHYGVFNNVTAIDPDTGENKGSYCSLVINGGRVGGIDSAITDVRVAPYMVTEQSGTIRGYDYYAVSNSPTVVGNMNYEFGYQLDLSLEQVLNLEIPMDQTYYLHGRFQNDEYHYLGCRYAGQSISVGDMTTWTKGAAGQEFSVTNQLVNGNYRNTLRVVTDDGWEMMYLPVKVTKNTNYILSTSVVAPSFIEHTGYTNLSGLLFGVVGGNLIDNCQTEIVQAANLLSYFDIVANYQGKVQLKFNSGNYETIYLVLNAGHIDNGQRVPFVFDNLRMFVDQNAWVVA